MTKKLFYILSFTWGLPLTLIGCVVAVFLIAAGHKPFRYGWCWYFEIGENWGGLELGIFFLTNKEPTKHLLQHESGHAIQNCYLGFLMPFIVCIPSALRYWYRELRYNRRNIKPPTKYDDIWFEGQATKLGQKYFAEMSDFERP